MMKKADYDVSHSSFADWPGDMASLSAYGDQMGETIDEVDKKRKSLLTDVNQEEILASAIDEFTKDMAEMKQPSTQDGIRTVSKQACFDLSRHHVGENDSTMSAFDVAMSAWEYTEWEDGDTLSEKAAVQAYDAAMSGREYTEWACGNNVPSSAVPVATEVHPEVETRNPSFGFGKPLQVVDVDADELQAEVDRAMAIYDEAMSAWEYSACEDASDILGYEIDEDERAYDYDVYDSDPSGDKFRSDLEAAALLTVGNEIGWDEVAYDDDIYENSPTGVTFQLVPETTTLLAIDEGKAYGDDVYGNDPTGHTFLTDLEETTLLAMDLMPIKEQPCKEGRPSFPLFATQGASITEQILKTTEISEGYTAWLAFQKLEKEWNALKMSETFDYDTKWFQKNSKWHPTPVSICFAGRNLGGLSILGKAANTERSHLGL